MISSSITRKIMERIGIVALIIILGTFLLSFFIDAITLLDAVLFSAGVLITSVVNCFKIYMISRTAEKLLNMEDPNIGKGYANLMFFVRYILTAAVVGVVVFVMFLITGDSPFITMDAQRSPYYPPMIMGLVVGLFSMKIAVITSGKLPDDTDEQSGEDLQNDTNIIEKNADD